ncbi:MAG: hypothetical protein ACRDZQ_13185 [Acidimicrobiales bacterium]
MQASVQGAGRPGNGRDLRALPGDGRVLRALPGDGRALRARSGLAGRGALLAALLALLGLGAAACGGGGPSPTTTASPAQAKAAVTKTWTTFFDAATPESKQVALLQDGSKYKPLITKVRKLLPAGTTADVKAVKVNGTHATVSYALSTNGSALLPSATGQAVDVNGRWLVSSTTFCSLVSLTGSHCPT